MSDRIFLHRPALQQHSWEVHKNPYWKTRCKWNPISTSQCLGIPMARFELYGTHESQKPEWTVQQVILDFWGPYARLCFDQGGGGFKWLRMKHICPCFTPSQTALAESNRETVSLPRLAMLSTRCFSLEQVHVTWFDWFLRRKGDSTVLQLMIIHVFIALARF